MEWPWKWACCKWPSVGYSMKQHWVMRERTLRANAACRIALNMTSFLPSWNSNSMQRLSWRLSNHILLPHNHSMLSLSPCVQSLKHGSFMELWGIMGARFECAWAGEERDSRYAYVTPRQPLSEVLDERGLRLPERKKNNTIGIGHKIMGFRVWNSREFEKLNWSWTGIGRLPLSSSWRLEVSSYH